MAETRKADFGGDGWIDISVPLADGMVHWPGDPPVRIERAQDMQRGDASNVTALRMGAHTGTHMDGPLHFLKEGAGLDEMPFSATLGPARVIAIADAESVKPEELARHDIRPGERLLFKTLNSKRAWWAQAFFEDFVYISREAAAHLSERGVRTVGVDYLSVGGFQKDGVETHRLLLEAGIWIIEGLDLSGVEPGAYDLVCLPLRILRSDGAPARALLGPRSVD